MSRERQKNQDQMELDFLAEPRGEAIRTEQEETELRMAKRETESTAAKYDLMEEILERDNLIEAWKRVKENQGSAGSDGLTVEKLKPYLEEHWPAIRKQMESGTYEPQPVKRVEIPKPDGGVRKLGIPTVVDRFIQQAVN